MRVIIVGSGAGGASAARHLAKKGAQVTVVEAGEAFQPFTRMVGPVEPLRRAGLLGGERTATRLLPHLQTARSGGLVFVRGVGLGGSTVLTCGNMVRAERGLDEIGLDLGEEFEEIESSLRIAPFPTKRWRPVTREMFEAAERRGLNPMPTPKVVDPAKCRACGLCELGCYYGARWDSRQWLTEVKDQGAVVLTGAAVDKVLVEDGAATGVLVTKGARQVVLKADEVVLAAGGIGTAQILKRSGLRAEDRLWADIVLTLGGRKKDARQLEEPPMSWYAQRDGYIISPYLDLLTHYFHKPWRNVGVKDRVGMMVKLADASNGAVLESGEVTKTLTEDDRERMEEALAVVEGVMRDAGVEGPFVRGMLNGGHLGGTVPLTKEDVPAMRPSHLPPHLWVADLSLIPRSQGMPTSLTAAAVALRVAKAIGGA